MNCFKTKLQQTICSKARKKYKNLFMQHKKQSKIVFFLQYIKLNDFCS